MFLSQFAGLPFSSLAFDTFWHAAWFGRFRLVLPRFWTTPAALPTFFHVICSQPVWFCHFKPSSLLVSCHFWLPRCCSASATIPGVYAQAVRGYCALGLHCVRAFITRITNSTYQNRLLRLFLPLAGSRTVTPVPLLHAFGAGWHARTRTAFLARSFSLRLVLRLNNYTLPPHYRVPTTTFLLPAAFTGWVLLFLLDISPYHPTTPAYPLPLAFALAAYPSPPYAGGTFAAPLPLLYRMPAGALLPFPLALPR